MKNTKTFGRFVLAVMGCFFLCVTLAKAQQTQGSVAGQVADPVGAAIPGAKVTITNVATGESRQATTDADGLFHADFLPVGQYEINVEAQGFRSQLLKEVHVQATLVTHVSVTMVLSSVSTSVQVTSQTPALDLEEGRISTVLSSRAVQTLPTQNREVYSLSDQQPGVVATLAPVVSDDQYNRFQYGFSANGASPRGNNYVLDGVTNNNDWLGGTPAILPSVEAISEFQVQTLNFSPQYGRNDGAIVIITTKSGGNSFHGDAYDYLRNPIFDAAGEFATPTTRPAYRQNDYGGQIGGPIRKDKDFFFVNVEAVAAEDNEVVTSPIETPQFRAEVAQERPTSIANEQFQQYPAGTCLPGTAQATGSIYDGNQPLSVAQSVPGIAYLDGPPNGVPTECLGSYLNKRPINGYQVLGRYDHRQGSSDYMFARFIYDHKTSDSGLEELRNAEARGFRAPFVGNFPSILLADTHIFSPTVVNDVRFSFMREYFSVGFDAPGAPNQTSGGISSSNYPYISFVNGFTPFGGNILVPRYFYFNNYQVADTLSISKGNHDIKVGLDLDRVQENSNYPTSQLGTYTFQDQFTFANDSPEGASMRVNPATGQPTGTLRHFREWNWGAFIIDDWKVNRRLALNLGVRWDYYGAPSEVNDEMSSIIWPSPLAHNQTPTIAQMQNIKYGQVQSLWQSNPYNFSPRVGFAWDPIGDGKTSVRGGFAEAYMAPYSNEYTNTARFGPPFDISASATAPTASGGGFGGPITYTIPATPSPSFLTGLGPAGNVPGTRVAASGIAPNLRMSYAMQYFFGIQRQLVGNYVVSANYVGTRGVDLPMSQNFDRADGNKPQGAASAPGFNPLFSSITLLTNLNHSNYNGLQLSLRKSFSSGFDFSVNYTFSKELDLLEPALGDYANTDRSYGNVEDAANPNLDWGPGEFNAAQVFTANGIWSLPTPGWNAFAKTVLGGWQMSGTLQLQSGRFFSVYCSNVTLCDYNGDGNGYDRPNAASWGNTLRGLSRSDFLHGIFPGETSPGFAYPFGFGIPTYGTNGNLGKGTFVGPGFAETDLSVVRKIPLSESKSLQFRAECYNVFNRVNLYLPGSDMANAATFGKSTTAFPARNLQFALKFIF